jgi:hypothetical protein
MRKRPGAMRSCCGSAASGNAALSEKLHRAGRILGTERSMNLVVWLPAMFVLGLVSMGVCYAFIFACEEI